MSGRFPGYQASPSHVGSTSSPTPSSRFAVRYVHGFCLRLPSNTPISGDALALLASSFRPVTADHNVPGFAWNGSLCVMPGTRKTARHQGVSVKLGTGSKQQIFQHYEKRETASYGWMAFRVRDRTCACGGDARRVSGSRRRPFRCVHVSVHARCPGRARPGRNS